MKLGRKLPVLLLALVMVVSCIPVQRAEALGAAFETKSYNAEFNVNEDFSINVTEKYGVNFKRPQHGLFRYIPYTTFGEEPDIAIKNVDSGSVPHHREKENNRIIIRLGDEDKTVTGSQNYTLKYDIVNYEDGIGGKQRFYVDLIPTGWATPIENFSATVNMPESVKGLHYDIYSGGYGSEAVVSGVAGSDNNALGMEDAYSSIKVKTDKEGSKIVVSGRMLGEGEGITIKMDLPENYFTGMPTHNWAMVLIILGWILIGALAFVLHRRFGRDRKVVETVEFYPPGGMDPLAASIYLDGSANYKDIGPLIVYMASKGYIEIKEEKSEDGKDMDVLVRRVQEPGDDEEDYVKTFYINSFSAEEFTRISKSKKFALGCEAVLTQAGDHYNQEELSTFTGTSYVLQIVVFLLAFVWSVVSRVLGMIQGGRSAYISDVVMGSVSAVAGWIGIFGLIRRENKKFAGKTFKDRVFNFIFVMMAVAGFVNYAREMFYMTYGFIETLIAFAAMTVAGISVIYMKSRSQQSNEILGRLIGFRKFLQYAELDRINALVEEDPSYFYKTLPYAYIFNLTDKWIKKFEKIRMPEPDWYYGGRSGDLYSIYYMNSIMNSVRHSVDASISEFVNVSSDNGSGGGFSGGGGGFSGGGIGGGGGGSW